MNKYIVIIALLLVTNMAWADEFKATNVEPLITASWNQNSPYTDFAPVNRSTHQHLYNGCVAVALSQVLHYWNWPTRTEETWFCANVADGVHGFEQQMLAGTEINWDSMLDDYVVYGNHKPTYGELLALGKGQILTSIVVEMKFKKEASGADASRFALNPWYVRPTEMSNEEGALDAPSYEERYRKVRTALTNGIPLLCTIDVAMSGRMVGHEIVVDGWKETNETDGQVHLNYGWGGYNDQWVPFETCAVKSFMFGFLPRPKVIPEPIPIQATLPIPVKWHFPTRGYSLTGFTIAYAEATEELETLQDDFETSKGTVWGESITREVIADCGNDSMVLCIDNASDRSTYTYPSQLLGSGAELSFKYRSDHAKNQSVLVEAYEASHGWKTLEALELCSADASEWKERVLSLSAYEDKATAIRFRTERAGVGADKFYGSPKFGIQIDDVKLTRVRKLKESKNLSVNADVRACSIGSDALDIGKTYVITVSPEGVTDGEAGYGVATTIVEVAPEKIAIVGVQSIHSDDYQFNSGIFRNGYIGTNQFAVYTSASATKLRATLSHPSLIDEMLIDDVAVPGTQTLTPMSVKLIEPKIESGDVGKWLVTLDFSNLTTTSINAQEMITLEAEDALGNVARKEIVVKLITIGNETAITPSAIPDYSGTPETEDDEPITPVETTCLVLFEANGGEGTIAIKFNNGDTISFPEVTHDGYTLDGWYTLATDGIKIDATAKVTQSATYYAHWIKNSDPETPDEQDDPDEPTEETPIIKTTFPIAADAGPNDDETSKTRFCPGVTKEKGWYDVNRTQYYNYLPPAPINLVYWWVDRYKVAKDGSMPTGYEGIEVSGMPTSDNGLTFIGYLDTLLTWCSDKASFFPTAMTEVSNWTVGEEGKLKAVGRQLYQHLSQGPVAFKIRNSSVYYGVIWGCEYIEDDGGNYASYIYFTCSKSKNDNLLRYQLKLGDMYNESANGDLMLPSYANSMNGLIDAFYPISGPVPTMSEGEVTVKVMVGEQEFDISKAFSKVENGSTITYTLDATLGKRLEIGGEQISIQPELADGDNETPFEVQEGKLIFNVKSIPGLKYQVLASESLDPNSFEPAGKAREAISTRRELTVQRSGETKGFYKIQVSR